ncbi:MAG: TolC family protein [bacterium]|nr:TolC family protein [bacterium]
MRSIKKYIISFVILGMLVTMCSYAEAAIFSKKKTEKALEPKTVKIEQKIEHRVTNLVFDDIYAKAKEHSYDLQAANFDVLISQQDVAGAKSEYLPKLYLSGNTEYNKSFSDSVLMPTYVGDTYVNPYTRYQSLLGVTLSYNVFDFGVRRAHLDMAKEDVILKKKLEKQALQELSLNIIDGYTRILMYKHQINCNEEVLKLSENNLEMQNRLFKAREISKTELNEQKVQVEKVQKRLNELKSQLAESLNLLSFYTGEEYDVENLTVHEIDKPNFDPYAFNDYTKTLVWDVHETILNKKMQELKVIKRTNLPKINLYSRYYLYGTDKNQYLKAYGIEPSNWAMGATLSMPIFDGLKNHADIKKAKLELSKLVVERDKAIAEYKNRLDTMRTNLVYLNKQLDNNQVIVDELTSKNDSMTKLLATKIISPVEANQTKIDLLNEQMEFEKNKVTQIAIMRAIQELTTYDDKEL